MEKIFLGNKECFIFDEHHQVIEAWNEYFQSYNESPIVITLDHHTDVLRAFDYQISHNPHWNWEKDLSLHDAITLLHHDEHIDYAIREGFIDKSYIISHTNSNRIANEKITVLCDNFLTDDIPLNSPILKNYFNKCLEDEFLDKFISNIPIDQPYILDIDLDYFKSIQSLKPKSAKIFKNLVKNCQFITISREEIWVKLLTFESAEKFNSDIIINKLSDLLNKKIN